MKGTQERRENTAARLVEIAAREVCRHKQHPRLKEKLVAVLNQKIAKDPNLWMREQVKVNWVTRNWQEIQKRAEELNHV